MVLKRILATSLYNAFHTRSYSTVRNNSEVVVSSIKNKLQDALDTAHLDVICESNTSSEVGTHIQLVVVTDKFHGLPMYKRYNLVNDILKEEVQAGCHTFTIVAKTPIQWHRSQAAKEFPLSPDSVGTDK